MKRVTNVPLLNFFRDTLDHSFYVLSERMKQMGAMYDDNYDPDDTQPFEAVNLQSPQRSWNDRVKAETRNLVERNLRQLMRDEIGEVDYHGMEEEPEPLDIGLDPDLEMAMARPHTNWLSEGIRSFGRTVFRGCNDLAERLERAS